MTGLTDTRPVNDADLTVALSNVRGAVLLPGDEGFAAAAMPWNVAVAQQPAAVVTPVDADDVVAVVLAAASCGLSVAAQPGGHGATRALDGAIVVRTAALDEIWIDTAARVARVGAGVKWGELLAAIEGTGLIGLAGSNPDVSVVGYLLGGGVSWFGRRYGIAASCLRAVELVDGVGVHRWVTDASDPELMWALRGGGGELGIVTRVEIDLPAEPQLHGGKLLFPITQAKEVLAAFTELTRNAPEGLTCWASVMHFPGIDELPELIRGKSLATVDLTWLGSSEELAELLAPLRQVGPALLDTVGPVPIGRLGEVAAEPTQPTPGLDWATTLLSLDDATVERLLAVTSDRSRCALTSIQIRHLGGAFRRPAADRPAATSTIEAEYLVFCLGVLAHPALEAPIRASMVDVAAAVAAVSLDRLTLTMLGAGEPLERVHDAATIDRLRAVKARQDPGGVIRGNHPLT